MKIYVIDKDQNQIELEADESENLYEVLGCHGVFFAGNCGGNKSCNSCMVYIDELKQLVKACDTNVSDQMHVHISFSFSNTDICYFKDYDENDNRIAVCNIDNIEDDTDNLTGFGFAIDIGTTTVAVSLINLVDNSCIFKNGFMNPQITFGADVSSRLTYAQKGEKEREKLRDLIVNRLYHEMKQMADTMGIAYEDIKKIAIVGNTTMMSFLMNDPIDGLCSYPFTPFCLNERRVSFEDVFLNDKFINAKVLILPPLDAFVGSDAVAGLVALNIHKNKEISMLIDLGTNGEIILYGDHKGVATSTACGPAFEGAFKDNGLYGSTQIDFLARFLKQGIMDETGLLKEVYRDKGVMLTKDCYITQDMIREIQLAKSAIYTGVLMMPKKLGIELTDISHVYIAGGFGAYLNLRSAKEISLLPDLDNHCYEIVGNTALMGATMALTNPDFIRELKDVIKNIKIVHMSNEEEFQKLYMKHMNFC